jgi:hypothetical protein
MKYLIACAALLIAAPALAQDKQPPAGGMPDMSKMGPWTRKPANEKATKKEITDFLKQMDEHHKKGDFEAATNAIDFPVYMVTDDSAGMIQGDGWSRDRYVQMMKPFFENMPKDIKLTHKPTIQVLSDAMATVVDDFTMTMGKQKMAGRNLTLLVKRDGQWKMKVMAEPGWGGTPMPAEAKAEMKK